jgi:hypothetical protein
MLGAGMTARPESRPFLADTDVSFSDILDNLELGFMGRARSRATCGPFGTDIIYMGLGADSARRTWTLTSTSGRWNSTRAISSHQASLPPRGCVTTS